MSDWQKHYQNFPVSSFLGNLFGQREFLEEIVKLIPRKALEVGAGSGSLSIFLSQLGFSVIASDNNRKVLELIRQNNKRFGGKINGVVLADSFRLPFRENDFDLIFHQGLLEHFPDEKIVALLKEQLRVAPRVLFSVPNQNYSRKDLGDERLMSGSRWQKILHEFPVVWRKEYSPKVFPRWYLPRARVQQMFFIKRRDYG